MLPAPAPTSEHRVVMKGVDSVREHDAGIALISSRSNIKFDKTTVYVLATGELATEESTINHLNR